MGHIALIACLKIGGGRVVEGRTACWCSKDKHLLAKRAKRLSIDDRRPVYFLPYLYHDEMKIVLI